MSQQETDKLSGDLRQSAAMLKAVQEDLAAQGRSLQVHDDTALTYYLLMHTLFVLTVP